MVRKFKFRVLAIALSISMAGLILPGCGNADVNNAISTEVSNIEESDTASADESTNLEDAKKAEEEARLAEEKARAEEERLKAEAEAKKAEEERLKAEAEAKKAEEDRLKVEEEAKKAEEEAKKAEEEAKKAEEERKKAEEEAKKAEEERKKAEEEAKRAEEENAVALTSTQLTSISMLNYMTVLTQQINNSKGNQLFLESARNSLYNDTNLKAVDPQTQSQINKLVGTIDDYRMVDVKRDRLQFIYEQNRAQALRQAIPGPMSILNVVQSGNLLKAAVSVVYMAVDSATSYQNASNQAELQFIQSGWELDDEETKTLEKNTTDQFNYMCNMVRAYDLPDEYVVRNEDVKLFVEWSNKTNLVAKIDWLVANESTYQKFGPYWLELVKDYYDEGDYKNCLKAIETYESISAKITRKDNSYANVLPMVIIAAKETMNKEKYISTARKYCEAIEANTKDEDWALKYFAAQIYMDIYKLNQKSDDLNSAYNLAYYNVNILKDQQTEMNAKYLTPVQEVTAEKGATKRTKEEIRQYNKLLKEERKMAVPPVSEALYLNCDLLFALANEKNISSSERDKIERLLHENGEDLFLTKSLDNKFRKNKDLNVTNSENISIQFDGKELVIPVTCISDRTKISVTVGNQIFDDWVVEKVERPKNSACSDFKATITSKSAKGYKYQAGDKISISVVPVEDDPDDAFVFNYEVVAVKQLFVFNGLSFERK